jgi:hypothetical protein
LPDDSIDEINKKRVLPADVESKTGWDDLLDAGLGHGFHDTRQGPRYTIAPAVEQEILDRILELNHTRYAEEIAAGLHDKKGKKVKPKPVGDEGALF